MTERGRPIDDPTEEGRHPSPRPQDAPKERKPQRGRKTSEDRDPKAPPAG